MTYFTIDTDNNITAFAELPADATSTFSSEKALNKLTSDWSMTRFVEVWNSFAGVAPFDELKPVKKFTDRKSAATRIWKAVQRLTPPPAATSAPVAAPKKRAKKSLAEANGSDTAQTGAPQASKKAEVLELLRRPEGATLGDIMKLTGWQAHTVRGFISGTLTKKLVLTVESFRSESKERTYRIKS